MTWWGEDIEDEHTANLIAHAAMLNYLTDRPEDLPVPNASALRREAAALLAEADRIESRPRDEFVEGTVLTFQKPGRYGSGWGANRFDTFKGDLKYAAIKAGNRQACWFLTGLTTGGSTWDALLEFIGEDNLHTVRTAGPQFLEPNTLL